MSDRMARWMNAKEAAAYIGFKGQWAYQTVNRLARQGKITAGFNGKSWQFKAEDLDNALFLWAQEAVR